MLSTEEDVRSQGEPTNPRTSFWLDRHKFPTIEGDSIFQTYCVKTWKNMEVKKTALHQADIKGTSLQAALWGRAWFVRPEIWKCATIFRNNETDHRECGWGHPYILMLASQNAFWAHRMRSGLTEWGQVSQNEVWPHNMNSCLTELGCPQNMMSGPKEWNLASQNEAALTGLGHPTI